jgi:hypothetical protein
VQDPELKSQYCEKKKKKEKKKMFSERSSRLVGKELDIIFGYISLEL